MVQAFEAASQSDAAESVAADEGAGGLNWLHRFVFAGRSVDHEETGAPEADEEEGAERAPTAESGRAQGAEESKQPRRRAPGELEFKVGPPPPPGGQLHDAETVTPGLRLSYRGDPRAAREAAAAVSDQRRSGARGG
jgi:hypothetical protein